MRNRERRRLAIVRWQAQCKGSVQSIQIEAEVSVTQRSAHEMYPFEMKITRTRLLTSSGVVVRGIAVRNDNRDTQTEPWIPHILFFFRTDTVTDEAYGRTDGQLQHWLWIVTTPPMPLWTTPISHFLPFPFPSWRLCLLNPRIWILRYSRWVRLWQWRNFKSFVQYVYH